MPATSASPAAPVATRILERSRTIGGDPAVIAGLAAIFVLLAAVTWRKWGIPEVDAGAELSTADLVAHGDVPYSDVRYFYGPLGLYSLSGAFWLFGVSFTTAFAFGLVQAAAIFAVFYALARVWLPPLPAGLATAVLMAIGFSGTASNFVLPHTNSATFGLLCVLGLLLALARERVTLAGVLLGLAALTRPEMLAVALGVAAARVAGSWLEKGRAQAVRDALRLGLPAILVGGSVLGIFAAVAGPERFFLENLWPVDFIREAGYRTQAEWMPLTAASALGLLARGAVYVGLVAGAVLAAERVARARWRTPVAGVVAARGRCARARPRRGSLDNPGCC